jgi:hypothetical protein
MTNGLRACLVVMPKGHDFEGVYNIAVRPAAVDAGLRVLRADELTHTSISGSGVWEWLRDATVVVADVTGKNPNVYYELGVAQVLAKPTLLIARDAGDIPSDLSHVRVLIYQSDTRSLQELRRGLTNSLRRKIEATTDQEIARRALGPLEVDHAQKDEVLRALIERAKKTSGAR